MTSNPEGPTTPNGQTFEQYMTAVYRAAVEYYGDIYEGASQFLFGLMCDLPTMVVMSEEVKPREAVTDHDRALQIGPMIANVCPGAIITDDVVLSYGPEIKLEIEPLELPDPHQPLV